MRCQTKTTFRMRGSINEWVYGIAEGEVSPGRGRIIAKCWSLMCPKGESGYVDTANIQVVDADQFREAVTSFIKDRLTESFWEDEINSLEEDMFVGDDTADEEKAKSAKLCMGLDVPRGTPGVTAGEDRVVDLGGALKMELAWIEPGSFMMGSPSSEEARGRDETLHSVTLTKGFWMGKYEVTQGQWQQVMGNNPSEFQDAGKLAPVEQVSWDDCQEFMCKLNGKEIDGSFRLPTEAEWEYACRAGTTTAFNRGKDLSLTTDGYPDLDGVAWLSLNSRKATHTVGQKPPNAWGLYDLLGNVWEWCQDWFGDYPDGSVTDPKGGSSGLRRVVRGGSWDSTTWSCRSAYRDRYDPSVRSGRVGFRVVLSR